MKTWQESASCFLEAFFEVGRCRHAKRLLMPLRPPAKQGCYRAAWKRPVPKTRTLYALIVIHSQKARALGATDRVAVCSTACALSLEAVVGTALLPTKLPGCLRQS